MKKVTLAKDFRQHLGFKKSAVSRLHIYLKMRAFKALKTNKNFKTHFYKLCDLLKAGSRAVSRWQYLDILPADIKVYNNIIV